jgi:hypothetical protein
MAFLCYEWQPSSSTSFKLQDGSNPSLRRVPRDSPWRPQICNSCEEHRAQGARSAAKSRRHSTPSSLPIRQVCGFLPVLINLIRLLPHALWLSIIFFHVWVIVDLLYPIARVCSKSFFIFVEICR